MSRRQPPAPVMTTEEWVAVQLPKIPPPTPEQLAEVRRLLTPTATGEHRDTA